MGANESDSFIHSLHTNDLFLILHYNIANRKTKFYLGITKQTQTI